MTSTPKSPITRWRKAAGEKRIVLHISGAIFEKQPIYMRYQGPEWYAVRVHADASAKPDFVADIRDLSAIPDESVDAIWIDQLLQTLPQSDISVALAECYRVLKSTGELGVCVPDLPAIATHLAHGDMHRPLYRKADGTELSAIALIYGDSHRTDAAFRSGFSAESLNNTLRAAGFCAMTILRNDLHLWLGSFKFEKGHPKYQEKTRIITDRVPDVPPAPSHTRPRHPGLLHTGKLSDELDVPPKLWDMQT
jgi:SAM-dependent methyltransferase